MVDYGGCFYLDLLLLFVYFYFRLRFFLGSFFSRKTCPSSPSKKQAYDSRIELTNKIDSLSKQMNYHLVKLKRLIEQNNTNQCNESLRAISTKVIEA